MSEVVDKPERGDSTSIDALRGFDMFWIVGGDDAARAIGEWWGTRGSHRFAEQFEHVEWEGFRFYDLIFPLFLFLVGVVLPFSLKSTRRRNNRSVWYSCASRDA